MIYMILLKEKNEHFYAVKMVKYSQVCFQFSLSIICTPIYNTPQYCPNM